jgi:hypothetical protein
LSASLFSGVLHPKALQASTRPKTKNADVPITFFFFCLGPLQRVSPKERTLCEDYLFVKETRNYTIRSRNQEVAGYVNWTGKRLENLFRASSSSSEFHKLVNGWRNAVHVSLLSMKFEHCVSALCKKKKKKNKRSQ